MPLTLLSASCLLGDGEEGEEELGDGEEELGDGEEEEELGDGEEGPVH